MSTVAKARRPTSTRARGLGPSEWTSLVHVLDAMPGYVLLVDEEHRIILANKAMLALTGKRPGELLGRYCPKAVHGQDGPIAGCPVGQAVEQGGAVEREVHDPQSGRWLLSCAYPTDVASPGGRKIFLHTTRDITDLKQAQEQVARELVERTALFGLLESSLAGATLDQYLENALLHLTSLPWLKVEARGAVFLVGDEPEILEMHAQRGLSEHLLRDCARVRLGHCLCGRAALTGEPVYSGELDARHDVRSEGIRDHGHYCVPLRSSGSGVLGVLNLYLEAGHAQDQAELAFLQAAANVLAGSVERRRAEEKVRDYQHNLEALVAQRTSQLAESNRQRQALIELAVMHDFGTPMTVLATSLEMLRDGETGTLSDIQSRLVAGMSRSLDALSGVRSSMLDVAGLGAGSISLAPAPTDVRQLVAQAAAEAEPLVKARQVELVVDAAEAWVTCDAPWLHRAVLSLILGICKYADSGVRIRVTAAMTGGSLTVTVADAAGRYEGELRWATGLELALVQAVAEAHGGSAGHRSGPDGRAEAFISIPVRNRQ